jgi:hypothetical protein
MPDQRTLYSIAIKRACAADKMCRWLDAHADDTDKMNTIGAAKARIVNDHPPQTIEDIVALITENSEALRHTSRLQQESARAYLVDRAESRLYEVVDGAIDNRRSRTWR